VLQDFEAVLNIPHMVQQSMSREQTPVLSGSIPAFEIFMSTWEKLAVKNPRLKPWIVIGLVWATKYYNRMDNTKAYIIAMCESIICTVPNTKTYLVINPSVRLSWIRQHWDQPYIDSAIKMIKDTVGNSSSPNDTNLPCFIDV
jgi:hypothetical protein